MQENAGKGKEKHIRKEPEQNITVSDGKQAPREGTDQLLKEDKDR